MRTRSFARLAVLVAVASVVAGCSGAKATNGNGGPAKPPLQLRLVTSSTKGPCNAQPLTSDGPGSACDRAGTTTYKLAKSLGVVTPLSVTRDDQGTGETVVVEFDKADASKLGDVTGKAIEKQLAVLFDGQVLAAPVVKEPVTARTWTFAFGTASEAEQVARELGAATKP
jgi:preprotein translocase subunit SecD